MRSTLFVGLLVSIQIANAHPAGNYDRGWRPMSKEDAFRQLRINTQKTRGTWGPAHPTADKEILALKETHRSWGPIDSTAHKEVISLKDDVMKVVEPVQVLGGFYGKDFGDSKEQREKLSTDQNCEGDIECFFDRKKEKILQASVNTAFGSEPVSTTTRYVRIAKKISEHTLNNLITHPDVINNVEDKYTNGAKATTSYEVRENNDETENSQNTVQNIVVEKQSGYVYNVPEIRSDGSKNLTQKFTEILSKYIDNNLKGQNYAISREPRKVNYFKPEFIYLPVPLKAFHGYNSNNHVSVNPMLAVLLSNYGYYLPGSFGHKNRYKNLYGYLASNNIHNNKPFGMYKLFSDTDSSN